MVTDSNIVILNRVYNFKGTGKKINVNTCVGVGRNREYGSFTS